MSIDPGTGSGQSSALMTPIADSSEQGGNNPNYPASFARRLPAGQVGTTSGDPMSQKKVKEIQNWRQSQVIPEDLQGALGGSNQDGECLLARNGDVLCVCDCMGVELNLNVYLCVRAVPFL